MADELPFPHFRVSAPAPDILSVTEVVSILNEVLSETLPMIRLEGEIQQLTVAQSGHLYLTLKDEQAQISAVMWRSSALNLRFRPQPGLSVRCVGRPAVYERTGKLQLILASMEPAGEGLLQKRFLELKRALEREGLFDPSRKRPIPFLPRAVGIVTSSTGAVIHDMMVKLTERFPTVPVYLVDVRVQGDGAAEEISRAIEQFNRLAAVDALIVARGGGSLEDLWAFNEERVVRAIFASRIPVISGVGHETDVTLADLAADRRAPTPTAAAELVVPRRDDLRRALAEFERRLRAVDRWLLPKAQDLDELQQALDRAIALRIERARQQLVRVSLGIRVLQPEFRLHSAHERLSRFRDRLSGGAVRLFRSAAEKLVILETRLHGASPTRILGRGYALVERDGVLVRSAGEVSEGASLLLTFNDGKVEATAGQRVAGRSVTTGSGA